VLKEKWKFLRRKEPSAGAGQLVPVMVIEDSNNENRKIEKYRLKLYELTGVSSWTVEFGHVAT
jgi:hypothetical protein